VSLFLADWAVQASNALVSGVILATGGLNHAWITNAVTLQTLANGTAPFIILIFLLIFLVVAIGLLLTLLKIPTFMMQLILFSRSVGTVRHMGSQIMNVMSTDTSSSRAYKGTRSTKAPRRTINI